MTLKINRWQAGLGLVFKVYRDKAKEWRWLLYSMGNGRTLADSGEGYKRKQTCVTMVNKLRDRMAAASMRVEDARSGRSKRR